MRSNISLVPVLLALAACGGRGGYGFDAAPAPAADAAPPVEGPAAPAPYDRGAGYARPGQDQPGDPTAGMSGPRGSSQAAPGELRYDEVGYAGVRGVAGGDAASGAVVAVSRGVPPGSYVEVTSLDSGHTILVLVTGSSAGEHLIDLSPSAARQLGATGALIPVRVRKVTASPQDQALLQSGHAAPDRVDAPPVLLTALRKHLTGAPVQSAPVASRPATAPATPASRPSPRPRPATPARGGYFVQVAALSSAARAQALASSLGGTVRPGGGLYRVQVGPYGTEAQAQSARASLARRGYPGATIVLIH